ncbi:hypothetical protein Tsubulata_035040 [Turnera subulata]|uniref:F-box domain-containing protein n=1 Tax=Turnera subulata TaxID=218843 RepID=A0A9Q0FWQ6_9ROSI|nr:hypothetical protein Tsubulata_035040 [Turnera subulata]
MEMETEREGPGEQYQADRLSNLPDAILHHILSFLEDTRAAAQTSVLSRRFRFLWTSLPDLCFDTKPFSCPYTFFCFVTSSLAARDRSCRLGRLRFYIRRRFGHRNDVTESVYDSRDIALRYAGTKGLYHLVLHNFPDQSHSLSAALLDLDLEHWPTLKTLELAGNRLPPSPPPSFAGITTLHLEDCVVGQVFDALEMFPNLAHLCLINLTVYGYDADKDCEDYADGVRVISGSKLLSLRMETDLRQCPSHSHIEISAPNLTVFRYKAFHMFDSLSVIDLPSLQHAQVYFSHAEDEDPELKADEFFNLLRGLRNAEFLKLNTEFLQALLDGDVLEHHKCSFTGLKSLKLLLVLGLVYLQR